MAVMPLPFDLPQPKPYANFTTLCVIESPMEFLYYGEVELLSTAVLRCGNEDFGCFVLL